MKKIISSIALFFLMSIVMAQNVGINNTNPTSALDINGGLRLRPVTSLVSGSSITLSSGTGHHFINGTPTGNFTINFSPVPDEGKHAIISNTTSFTGNLFGLLIPPATTVELFYSNGGWKEIGSSQPINNTAWRLTGNTATDTALHFIGTADDKPLVFKIDNKRAGLLDKGENTSLGYLAMPSVNINAAENTGMGARSLNKLLTGTKNTAVGVAAAAALKSGDLNVAIGQFALATDSVGSESVAVGGYALGLNQNREGNTAVGSFSLFNNTNPDLGVISAIQGLHNTAVGYQSLFNNRSGSGAVAMGYKAAYSDRNAGGVVAIGRMALYNNDNREGNTAVGDSALFANGTGGAYPAGSGNTAVGTNALLNNTTGYANTAIGTRSLNKNITGTLNTAIGLSSLTNNISGDENTAIGHTSLFANESGDDNIAIGLRSLQSNISGNANVAIGVHALNLNTTQSYSVAVGDSALFWNGFSAFGTTEAEKNTAVGSKALFNNRVGAGNVGLGFNAGFNETGSNKLYIENTIANKDNALIYGDFAADSILLNAKTINRNSLHVRGNNAFEMGYGVAGKQTDAGKICYGCFGDPANWLGIVGGGTNALGNDRVIKLWSEGGLRIRGNAMPDFGSTYTLGNQAAAWRSATADSVRSNAYMLRNSAMHIVGATGELGFRLNSSNIAKINSGGIMPAADNDIYLGAPSLRFVAVYAVNGMIQTSDARLKTNITSSGYGLDEVMKMQPVQYNWKSNPNNDLQIGFLAQDIQKIIPEAVVEPANGDAMGMKYNELIPVLVKAIQEQQQKIEELEKMIKALQK